MADYYIDVKHTHKDTAAELIATLTGRYQQWGFEEDGNKIAVVDSVGNFLWFWSRVGNNIALKGGYLSNDGTNLGIKLSDAGAVKFVGDDNESSPYAHASTGNYRVLLIDEDGFIVVGTTDVAKSIS